MSDNNDISNMSEIELELAIRERNLKILEIKREILSNEIDFHHKENAVLTSDKPKKPYEKDAIIFFILLFFTLISYMLSIVSSDLMRMLDLAWRWFK